MNGFHRDLAAKLLDQLASLGEMSNWQRSVLNMNDFSEFILYGVFAESKGLDNWHYDTDEQLCFSSWFYDLRDKQSVRAFVRQVPDSAIAIHVQSNLGFDASVYASVVRSIHRND